MSPLKYSQTNGLSERSVQTVKRIFSKAKADKKDPLIGLLEYRATPLEIGQSPAEILFGRQIRSVLPVVKERLIPRAPNTDHIRNGIMSNKQKVKQYYDRTAKSLKPLAVGDTVCIKLNYKLWKLQS